MTRTSTRALSRHLGAAACLATALVLGGNALPIVATATAQAGAWDPIDFDDCVGEYVGLLKPKNQDEMDQILKACCESSGGVWKDNHDPAYGPGETCVAPPPDSHGTRQLPGGITIPPDLGNAPVVTTQPPRPPNTGR
jgi:hypothetical protein